MVKNKIVRFIVPILTCCFVVIACVVPAKAVTSFPDDEMYRPWIFQSIATGDFTVECFDLWENENPMYLLNYPLNNVTIDSYENTNNIAFTNSFLTGSSRFLYSTYNTSVPVNTFEGFGVTDNRYMYHRLDTGLKEFGVDGEQWVVGKVTLRLNSFSLPVFNQATMLGLMRLVALEGAGTFNTKLTIKHVGDDGVVKSFTYSTEEFRSIGTGEVTGPYSSGASTALDWNDMLAINTLFNADYNGGRILVEGFTVEYRPHSSVTYAANNLVRFRTFAFPLEDDSFSGPYPWAYYDAEKFYTSNNIIYTNQSSTGGGGAGPEYTNNTVSQFIGGALTGVLETEIGYGITLGGIFITVVGCAIAVWILKLFAGG